MAGKEKAGSARNKERAAVKPEINGRPDGISMYSAGEVCTMTGTTRKTLFYYDRIGLLEPTERTGAQRVKQYDDEKVGRLRKILEYRNAGLGISEIRELLDGNADHLQVLKAALERMLKEREETDGKIARLQGLIRDEEARKEKKKGQDEKRK